MLSSLLAQCAGEDQPIRVGIIGTGKFGGGLVAQVSRMVGMETSAVADIQLDHARRAYAVSGISAEQIDVATSANEIDDAIRTGKRAVVEDGLLLAQTEQLDVIVEATGIPEVGARMAYEAITHNKHVVMVNVEADVTVGPILRHLADSAGVVYTLVDGDQPGCTMNIVDWSRSLGFEVVAAGRGTILFEDDPMGTPDTVPERFGFDEETLNRRAINLKMYNSFRDGTKAQVEMTALANAAGLPPDVRGMHEPSVNLADIPQQFSLQEEGRLLSRHGVVELANSVAADGRTMLPDALRMGVFVVIRTDHPFTQEDLAFYHLHPGGNGQNFLLYRPYHLIAVEAPISIAKAALYGQATGAPLTTPVAEVITVAKRNLEEGTVLDGGGGYTVNGLCEKATVARTENLLPLGLAAGARLKQDVAHWEAITYDMVELNRNSFIYKLRQIQNATQRLD
ncbi:NAD(P)-dependent oxidoreductase [Chloroflexi bacterium TSY]|nr:NAD(P)-dependent oxidoreductase [Chloroflexi bacterium TSY]